MGTSARVVVAPDAFKGTASATAAAAALAAGWRATRPGDRVESLPQADGGEGTAEVVAAAVPGSRWRDVGEVTGPDGAPVPGRWLELPDGTAVVELAITSGLPLVRRPVPLDATTAGLGQVLRHAVEAGARRVVVGVGGSASTDGGAGALVALGLRVLDADGVAVPPGGRGLLAAARVVRDDLLAPPPDGVVVLTDVDAPLTGPAGAAAVFGPQKGAGPRDVGLLDRALRRWADLLGGRPQAPGAGAAGGTAYGLAAVWGAALRSGAAEIAALSGLREAAERADLLLTGEGRFDETSCRGKVVGEILRTTATPVVVVAGEVDPSTSCGGRAAWTVGLVDLAGDRVAALGDPGRWLRAAGARAAAWFGGQSHTSGADIGNPRGVASW